MHFSHQLMPTLEQLTSYGELNTPLPFIVYGQIQRIFSRDLFEGRLLNFLLSIIISLIIGWPKKDAKSRPVLALLGLFVFPYFLWFSTRYYTDIMAVFFVLLGFIAYFKKLHVFSALAFVLGISSRQYMIAFPLAIATHELVLALRHRRRLSMSFFMPVIAASSILVWIFLFNGLAPEVAMAVRSVPEVQQEVVFNEANSGIYFGLQPSNSLYSLAGLGLFYVIPEYLLFRYPLPWQKALNFKSLLVAAIAIVVFIIFPPYTIGKGVLWKITQVMPIDFLVPPLFFILILITCWRFYCLDISSWLVVLNAFILSKAFPWDKYLLPLIVVLWYLKARKDNGGASGMRAQNGGGSE
ncbi:hypothetical protein C7271_11725 [filamentous cyanobacterium CCP5]|nr:hypothetical protein C7271_11725 [filamentous cyanobacterium CCP5]